MKRKEMLISAATGAAGIATLAAVTQSMQAFAQAAASPGGVLDRIIKEKKIRVTAEVTSPPCGILDRNNQPTDPRSRPRDSSRKISASSSSSCK